MSSPSSEANTCWCVPTSGIRHSVPLSLLLSLLRHSLLHLQHSQSGITVALFFEVLKSSAAKRREFVGRHRVNVIRSTYMTRFATDRNYFPKWRRSTPVTREKVVNAITFPVHPPKQCSMRLCNYMGNEVRRLLHGLVSQALKSVTESMRVVTVYS